MLNNTNRSNTRTRQKSVNSKDTKNTLAEWERELLSLEAPSINATRKTRRDRASRDNMKAVRNNRARSFLPTKQKTAKAAELRKADANEAKRSRYDSQGNLRKSRRGIKRKLYRSENPESRSSQPKTTGS